MAKIYPSDRGNFGLSDINTNPYGSDLTPEEQAEIQNKITELALGPGSVSGGISNISRLPLLSRLLSKAPQIEEQATKLIPKPELSQPYPSPDFINPEQSAARKAAAQQELSIPKPQENKDALQYVEARDLALRGEEAAKAKSSKPLEDTVKLETPEMLKRPDPEVDLKGPLQSEDMINIFGTPISKNQLKLAGLLTGGAAAYPLIKGNETEQTPPGQPLPNKVQEEIKKQEPTESKEAKEQPEKAVDRALAESPKQDKKEEKKQEETPKESEEKAITEEQPKMKELDFSGPSEASVDNLRAAQEAQRSSQLANIMQRAGMQYVEGKGGLSKPLSTSVVDALDKQAADITKQYQDRVEMEKNDPDSSYSKGFRNYLKQFGYEVKGGSAEQLGKILPFAFKSYENEQAAKLKQQEAALNRQHQKEELAYKYKELKEVAKLKQEAMKQDRALKLEEKQEQMDTRRFDELGKRLTAETSSSRSAFGRAANVARSAESIEALTSQYNKDLNQLDRRQIMELARSLDAMLAQGQPTISGTKKLIPETLVGDANKIAEYIAGLPRGAQQKEFVQRMLDTVGREKELAYDQIRRTQGKILSPYKDLESKYPDKYGQILQDFNLKPKISEENLKLSGKVVVKKGYNPKTNQTQLIYSDGSKEIVEGRQ